MQSWGAQREVDTHGEVQRHGEFTTARQEWTRFPHICPGYGCAVQAFLDVKMAKSDG